MAMSRQQTRQLNIGTMDPQLLHDLDVWYQSMKVDFLEHGLPAPLKQEMAGQALRVGLTVLGHFIDKWVFSDGKLSLAQALESAERNAKVEISHEELRKLIKMYFEKQTDKLVDAFLPYFERRLREEHGH